MSIAVDARYVSRVDKDHQRLEIAHLLRVVRRHLAATLAIVAVAVAIAALVAATSPKSFTATATIRITPAKQSVLQPDASAAVPNDPTAALIETEMGELKSYGLARTVAMDLHLENWPEFNASLRPASLISRLMHRPTPPMETSVDGQVVGALLSHVKIDRMGASYLLNVSVRSVNPQRAAQIANSFVQEFMRIQQGTRASAVESGSSHIRGRLDKLREEVESADTKLQQYKIANGLLSAEGATLTEQEISGLDQRLAEARAGQVEADAKLKTAKSQVARGSNGADVGEALGSPVIQQLRQRRAEVSQRLAALRGRYSDKYPKVVDAQRELTDIDSQIQAEIERIIANLDAQAKVAGEQVGSIEHSVGRSRGSLEENDRAAVKLNELQRSSDAAKGFYDTFLNRFKEADAEAGFQTSDAQIVDQATAPTSPSEPKKTVIVIFGLLVGLSGAIGYMMVAEHLSQGLADVDSVERILHRPYLGSVPLLRSTLDPQRGGAQTSIDNIAHKPVLSLTDKFRNLVTAVRFSGKAPPTQMIALTSPIDYIVDKPVSSFAEGFRSLVATVRFSDKAQPPQVIAVTSSLPNEGKTTTSICMARIAALAGTVTVLVDCDLRKRSINRLLSVEPEVGLVEVLTGRATLDEALKIDEETGLVILPLALSDTPMIKDLLATEAMETLIAELRRRFELVVLDTGPVMLVTSSRQLARHADAVLVLAQWRKTSRRTVQTSLRLLDAAGAKVAGVALGQVDLTSGGRIDPSDPSSFYRSYRQYYADA